MKKAFAHPVNSSEAVCPPNLGLFPNAAKRRQKVAQGASPGVAVSRNASPERAADAVPAALSGLCARPRIDPALTRWAILLRRFAALGNSPLVLLCCLYAALPLAAQTPPPQNAERKRDSAQPQEMVLIPAGKFWMGRSFSMVVDSINVRARDSIDDVPANNIYLDAFYIDKYEVTNADYARFLAAKGGKAPWHWPQGKIPNGEERVPVYNVNWFEATDFCTWAGKRLPTEAEWEKSARGGLDRKVYSWGDDDIDKSEIRRLPPASSGSRTGSRPPEAVGVGGPVAVGKYPPNGYGLYDIGGNVSEWLSDWYYDNYYPFIPKRNPKGPETGLYRSVRGANWATGGVDEGHPAYTVYFRNFSDPELRITTMGFRCAQDAR